METVDSIVFGALALGLLVSFALAVPVAGGMLTARRTPFVLAVALLAAGVAWTPVYAAAADRYFIAGDVSRWEYATRDGRGTTIVAAGVVAIAALCVAAVAVAGRPRAGRSRSSRSRSCSASGTKARRHRPGPGARPAWR